MSEPFIAEVRIMAFGFAPRFWAQTNGQLLPINQNQALFALIGTTFGGNGQTTFALPDLRGRMPSHSGPTRSLGQQGGAVTAAPPTQPSRIASATAGPVVHVAYAPSTVHSTQSPFLALNFTIALSGIFPSRN